jgi:hypothetical protein
VYSGHYPGTFVAPKNAQNAETKRWSGARPIPLLALSASTTSAYTSLGVLQELNPRPQLLKASVKPLSHISCHLNSVISTKGARYCTIDLKDFYLMTPMARPKFMCMKIKALPTKNIELYKLNGKATSDGFIYIKIQKGMYGLPQAGILA